MTTSDNPPHDRAARILDAGLLAFTATTGALLMFAHQRGPWLAPFAHVGRRVARDIVLPVWGDATIGLVVHLGHCLALGAIAVLARAASPQITRLRAALLVTILWQLATLVPWLAVIRADMALTLSFVARAGLAVLLIAALTLGGRAAARNSERETSN